jgi:hypothetical protein
MIHEQKKSENGRLKFIQYSVGKPTAVKLITPKIGLESYQFKINTEISIS